MKISHLLLVGLLGVSSACNRGPSPEVLAQQEADERRITELRELEDRAAERVRTEQNQAEQARIDQARAALEREQAELTQAQRELKEQRLAQLRTEERQLEAKRTAEKAAAETRLQQARAQQVRSEQKIEFFYDVLDPLGDWLEIEQYGYVWQPREAQNSQWRPYTDGSWAWTEYGWTWASNENFGWATYHYGRWARLKQLGWVWVPGSEWAPAWVAWRRNESFVGWAPLPPDAHSGSGFNSAVDSYYDIGPTNYIFVPMDTFGETTYVGRAVNPDRNVFIVNQTTNVTNISYQTVQNKTAIFNAGPEREFINQRSRNPVRQFTLQKVSDQKAIGAAKAKGNVLQLAAPVITSAARPSKPPSRVKERAPATELDHGWSSESARNSETSTRAKITKEAHAAEDAQRSGTTPKNSIQKERPSTDPEPGAQMTKEKAPSVPAEPKVLPKFKGAPTESAVEPATPGKAPTVPGPRPEPDPAVRSPKGSEVPDLTVPESKPKRGPKPRTETEAKVPTIPATQSPVEASAPIPPQRTQSPEPVPKAPPAISAAPDLGPKVKPVNAPVPAKLAPAKRNEIQPPPTSPDDSPLPDPVPNPVKPKGPPAASAIKPAPKGLPPEPVSVTTPPAAVPVLSNVKPDPANQLKAVDAPAAAATPIPPPKKSKSSRKD